MPHVTLHQKNIFFKKYSVAKQIVHTPTYRASSLTGIAVAGWHYKGNNFHCFFIYIYLAREIFTHLLLFFRAGGQGRRKSIFNFDKLYKFIFFKKT